MKFFKKKEDTFDYFVQRICLTCETSFQGKYCSKCGEKVVEPYDRSIKHFLDNLLNALTFIDGKFYRSFKVMVSNPGKMSADIAVGIRQPYMKPVAFFFVGNFIYFFIPLFQTFNTPLHAQVEMMPYSFYVKKVVYDYLEVAQIDIADFTPIYNAASTNWAKIVLILIAPLTFPFVSLINYSKKSYLSDHFIFSLEFSSFLIFVPTIIFPFLIGLVVLVGEILGYKLSFLFQDTYSFPVVVTLIALFFFFSTRRFYQFPWWRVILSSVLLTGSMYFVVHAYRFILFLITMTSV